MSEDRADDVDYCCGEVPADGVTRERATQAFPQDDDGRQVGVIEALVALRHRAPDDTVALLERRYARQVQRSAEWQREVEAERDEARAALAAATAREATLRAGIETIAANLDSLGDYGVADGIDDLRALLADTTPGSTS